MAGQNNAPVSGGAAGNVVCWTTAPQYSAPQGKSQRLSRAMKAAGDVLALLPDADNPGELVVDLALVWRQRLGPVECLTLTSAGHLSLDAGTSELLAETALADHRTGEPHPPFMDLQAEAGAWAMFASPAERKAYFTAIWNVFAHRDRQAFLKEVGT